MAATTRVGRRVETRYRHGRTQDAMGNLVIRFSYGLGAASGNREVLRARLPGDNLRLRPVGSSNGNRLGGEGRTLQRHVANAEWQIANSGPGSAILGSLSIGYSATRYSLLAILPPPETLPRARFQPLPHGNRKNREDIAPMGLFSKDIKTLNDLFVHTFARTSYYAEKQIVKSLPDMIAKASDPALKRGFKTHLDETQNHVARPR